MIWMARACSRRTPPGRVEALPVEPDLPSLDREPARRSRRPIVDLPLPLSPTSATTSPCPDSERHVTDRLDPGGAAAVAARQTANREHDDAPASTPRPARRRRPWQLPLPISRESAARGTVQAGDDGLRRPWQERRMGGATDIDDPAAAGRKGHDSATTLPGGNPGGRPGSSRRLDRGQRVEERPRVGVARGAAAPPPSARSRRSPRRRRSPVHRPRRRAAPRSWLM